MKRIYYKIVHGIKVSFENGSMLPKLGKGRYVSVYRKGNFVDIVNEGDKNCIRLVPYQPNHGVMVEFWKNKKLLCRDCMSYTDFFKICSRGEVEWYVLLWWKWNDFQES